jgi:hypothetical protein
MALESFFSIKEGVLYFAENPISDETLDDTRRVVEKHVVPRIDERMAIRSMLFCIASQRTEYERAVAFTQLLEDFTIDELLDPWHQVETAKKAGLPHSNKHPGEKITDHNHGHFDHMFPDMRKKKKPSSTDGSENRFSYISSYFKQHGATALAQQLLANPIETRRQLVNDVKWIAGKTGSFWYLTLGGRALLTMDVHNYRQLAGIIPLDKKYTVGDIRATTGEQHPSQPSSLRGYEEIEATSIEQLRNCPSLYTNGEFDGALVTGLFWTIGAMEFRGCHPSQHSLVKQELAFRSPYTAYRK